MRIVVLAKQVPDTWTDRKLDLETGLLDRDSSEPVADEINERALECALQYKDQNPETDIVLLSMGREEASETLRKLLAMGADSAVLVTDPLLAGSDMVQTARVLAAAAQRVGGDLVIAGNEATDGRGGMVPAMVSESLGWPVLPGLEEVQITPNRVSGQTRIDGGALSLSADLPALLSVTERAAEARFPSFKGIMRAKKKPLETWSLADLDISVDSSAVVARSVMVGAEERPPKQAGPKITDDGTAAAQLADFLVSHRLV